MLPLPPKVWILIPSLRLDLSYNKLTGSLPPNLLELALKHNTLSGYLSNSSFDELTISWKWWNSAKIHSWGHYKLGKNLPNSSFLEKILVHSMQMKHFSKLDCFWNSSSNPFKLNFLLGEVWNGPKKIKKKVELESRKLEFHLSRTWVS